MVDDEEYSYIYPRHLGQVVQTDANRAGVLVLGVFALLVLISLFSNVDYDVLFSVCNQKMRGSCSTTAGARRAL